ncbi:MAG: transcription termination factor Rho [Phycisphaerae bacterium]
MGENAATTKAVGVVEKNQKGGGELRNPQKNLGMLPADVLVTPDLMRKAQLRGGELVVGTLAANGKGGGRRAKLDEIETVDGLALGEHLEKKTFESLTAIDPNRQIRFEHDGGPMTMRVIDLLAPIGFGQRGLIVAPPRSGKTVLLQQMAQAVTTNYPDVHVIVLLIDERPEEVTDMRRNIDGQVIASSNDKDAASHVRLARLVTERTKRLVEAGQDVFLLLDSLTRLGRAFNAQVRSGGRIMSGGLDINALQEPKSIFGAARNLEEGGSLTIVASALIETGSRMDDVIFNEFKGTGNMELILSREMANRRVWPAIDLNPSGTRKEELLLTPERLELSHAVRRKMQGKDPIQVMESLLTDMQRHETNDQFVASQGGSRPRGPRFRRQ